jgi:adenylate kinase family enzyme
MQLVIISGPPNAGKSATAEALCQRYDRMLHIDVAVLRDFLRMGRLRESDGSPVGRRQRALFIGSATDMARRFLDAGYGVVIDDVIT